MVEIISNQLYDIAYACPPPAKFNVEAFGNLLIWFCDAMHVDIGTQRWVDERGGMV